MRRERDTHGRTPPRQCRIDERIPLQLNVLLGGGLARFQQVITGGPDVGKTVIQSAQRQGYSVVFDAANLDATEADRVLGLFNPGNMALGAR
jgi:alkaline phosphatase